VRSVALATLVMILSAGPAPALAQSLDGSRASVLRQARIAREHDYTLLRDEAHLLRFVRLGLLVPLQSNADFRLNTVSFPYARPEVRTFIHRLSAQYRRACGERLVVTSLTRPLNRQPRNASNLSVHPAGMAVDLRIPANGNCRRWLESTLLFLEGQGVVEATRERRPPHYHVAVFPTQYRRYVARLGGEVQTAAAPAPARAAGAGTGAGAADGTQVAELGAAIRGATGGGAPGAAAATYRVRRGDTLWQIARRHGTTIEELKEANGLSSPRILPGQMLTIPAR
jgi:hypothetical protein